MQIFIIISKEFLINQVIVITYVNVSPTQDKY